MKKKLPAVILAVVLIISVLSFLSITQNISLFKNSEEETPFTYRMSSAIIKMNVDYLINHADLIVIGKITNAYPNQWSTSNGKLPSMTNRPTLSAHLTIISDKNFQIDQIIKGDSGNTSIRIRIYGGTVGNYRVIAELEPTLMIGEEYLLFLKPNTGSTKDIFPGNFQILGVSQGAYLIKDGKAKQVNGTDEWALNDLMVYIQKSLSGSLTNSPSPTSTPMETTIDTLLPTITSTPEPTLTELIPPTPE